jgi:hypothetical protein
VQGTFFRELDKPVCLHSQVIKTEQDRVGKARNSGGWRRMLHLSPRKTGLCSIVTGLDHRWVELELRLLTGFQAHLWGESKV